MIQNIVTNGEHPIGKTMVVWLSECDSIQNSNLRQRVCSRDERNNKENKSITRQYRSIRV